MAKLTEDQNIYELSVDNIGKLSIKYRIDKWIAAKDFTEALGKARDWIEANEKGAEITSLELVGNVDIP